MTEILDLYGDKDVEAMYQAALRVPLEEKEEIAILTFQAYEQAALERSPGGIYECFSGGKDSIVMDDLAKRSGVKFTRNYSVVTIDPPELVQFIKKHYPDTIFHKTGKGSLPMYMRQKSCGPPTRLARWCCEIYKEQGGRGLLKAIGVRTDESARRKGMWQTMTLHKSDLSPILSPILYWTESDVWNYIRKYNLPYCCLYDQGFKRLGCIGCPMGGAKGMARDFAKWPKYEALWKRGFAAYWNKYKGTPTKKGEDRWIEKFPDVESFWNWWVSGKAYEGDQPDCQLFLW